MVEQRDKSCSYEKEAPWKRVLAARDEETNERCMEAYRETREVKRCIIQSKQSK